MYFEEIFEKVYPLWKKEFSLYREDETETYFEDISDDFDKVEEIVETNKDKYSEWEEMLVFTMYQALTAKALEKWNLHQSDKFFIDEVSIPTFEKFFFKNLKYIKVKKYLKEYDGLKYSNDEKR